MSPCPSEVSDNALGPLYGCRQTKRSEEVLGTAPVLVGHLFIGVNCAAQGLQSRNGVLVCKTGPPSGSTRHAGRGGDWSYIGVGIGLISYRNRLMEYERLNL